jgi:hypothetical protein
MDEDQIREAAGAVLTSVGISAYLYGINYDVEHWGKELAASIDHIKSQAGSS